VAACLHQAHIIALVHEERHSHKFDHQQLSPVQALEPVPLVVKPVGHWLQVRLPLAVPPREKVPFAQAVQLAPAWPATQTAQGTEGSTALTSAWLSSCSQDKVTSQLVGADHKRPYGPFRMVQMASAARLQHPLAPVCAGLDASLHTHCNQGAPNV